ncbi:MAG TPA: hypothetical protein VHF69_05395 [Candidatus Synoicihabitans sp.]|nr:hypothetical protein [Candidatus Synoicihabitans sp.]
MIAVVALIAVFVGALEHEDLILQVNAGTEGPAVECGEQEDRNATAWCVEGGDSGTEGTFRASSLNRGPAAQREVETLLRWPKAIGISPAKCWRLKVSDRMLATIGTRVVLRL